MRKKSLWGIKYFLLMIAFTGGIFAQSITRYVSPGGSNSPPYTSLATAATNIQSAITASSDNDIVLVANGTYILTSPVTIVNGVTIRSLNGYTVTTVNGNNVTPCFVINNTNAVIDGFTITNGFNPGGFGGGVDISSGGTVQNCYISNCQARDGGGVAIDNSGMVLNCILTGNKADNNSGDGYGGGVRMLEGGITRNCLVLGNTSANLGGGINIWDAGTIQNCTVVNNTAPNGAGVRCRGTSVMENTISYFNNGLNWQTEGSGYSFSNNCTTPALPGGTGNITSDPLFVNAGTGNYHLSGISPCFDAGLNESWMATATDPDHNSRIIDGIVDIGAYEYQVVSPLIAVPQLSWPIGNATIYSLRPVLIWYLNSLSTGLTYEAQCVRASDPWPADNVYALVSEMSYTFTSDLAAGTQYAWRIRSRLDNTHKSNWSATGLFTTAAASVTPLVPVTSWPNGNATIYLLRPTLNWYINGAGTGLTYEAQCVKASDPWPADNVYASVTGLNYTFTSDLSSGTQYAWRVRSRLDDTHKSNWSETALFTTVTINNSPVVPVTSWPIGNATIYSLRPTLIWYLNSPGAGLTYEAQCVKASDPWPADNVYASVTGLTYAFTSDLTSGTQYAWRVRSRLDDTHKSSWSETALFTTVGVSSAPIVPITSWPIGNATIYSLRPALIWYLNGVGTGLTYEAQCVRASDPWPADNVYASITGTTYTFTSDLTSGVQYAWRVRSRLDDTHKSNWSETALFTTVGVSGGPITPVVSWPTGNTTVYTLTPMLIWYLNGLGTGLTFEAQCVPASAPWPADNVYASVSGTTYTFTSNLIPGTQYAWRVRSRLDDTHKSDWSGTALFTTFANNQPVSPVAGSPVGGISLPDAPMLSWYLPTAGNPQKYNLQYSTNSDMSDAVTISNVNDQKFSLNSIETGTYYWRVNSVTENGQTSSYSAVGKFQIEKTILGVGNEKNVPSDFKLEQNYPNPFNPSTIISYSLPKNSFVTLKLYDMLGREIKTLINTEMNSGKHSVEWNGDDNSGRKVSSGTYLYRMVAGNFTEAKKLTLIK